LYKKGLRCTVCTGCGQCPGISRQLHIVTNPLEKATVDLRSAEKLRLITADVGTTTIAMQLHNEDGGVADTFVSVNPQVKYGADVLSRIAAARQPAVAEEMRRLVLAELEKGIVQFQKHLSKEEKPLMVLAANTTMVYLLMGWEPQEIGCAPFTAKRLDALCTEIAGIACYIFPGLSAFVGGDIVAGIYACHIPIQEKRTLLIDLGTNGEMVLGNREKLIACATAAGPAFEGGVNRGIWGADMIHLLAEMLKGGLMDENGLIAEPYFETGVRIGNVTVTQEAVRAVQLAKAAIATGIKILCRHYGCEISEIDRMVLAGGFGYYLSPTDAEAIGLLPKELAARTVTGGNTALAGALTIGEKLIQGADFTEETAIGKSIACSLEILNLAEVDSFETEYLEAMKFAGL